MCETHFMQVFWIKFSFAYSSEANWNIRITGSFVQHCFQNYINHTKELSKILFLFRSKETLDDDPPEKNMAKIAHINLKDMENLPYSHD